MVENKMRLNNLLQRRYGNNANAHIRWEYSQTGPDHCPTWTAIVYGTRSVSRPDFPHIFSARS
ncbi:hypothetical protein M405DRAFT_724138 [Rhizopogon salebrosus TDB-379]|nr:hypothetical protein M405DRAFT_724138 [Rhizopogon salebrosus TDB-379]